MTPSGGEPRDLRWWFRDDAGEPIGGEPHRLLATWINRVRERQAYRKDRDLLYLGLYGTDPILGFGIRMYSVTDPSAGRPIAYNVVRSVVETLTSRICKQKPKPWAQTSGASWTLQREAKKLTKFNEGQFNAQKVYQKRRAAVTHAGVFGTGALKVVDEGGEPECERTFTPELYVDDGEAKYGDPQTMAQVRTMDRLVAAEKLAPNDEKRDLILYQTAPAKDEDFYAFDFAKDQIDIFEGWHLPSGPDADDGRHVVCTESCTLVDEPWRLKDRRGKPRYPFAFLRYSEPLLGFYGTGLAQLLVGKQLEINKLLGEIQRSFHLGSNFRILCERGSRIIKTHFNNEIGTVLEYTGVAPTFAVAQTVHPEKFQHLLWLIQSSFAEAGISAMSAAGQKDPTLKSGRAQEVAMDIEDSRYADFQQADEEFVIDVADLLTETARASGRDQVVMYTGGRHSEVLKLSEIDMPRDKYVFAMYPTSAFASTPAARMEQVQDLINAGSISPEEGNRLLDFPEREDFSALQNATYEDVRDCLERIVEKGEYRTPLPIYNLDQALKLSNDFYISIRRMDDIEEKRKDLVLQYVKQIIAFKKAGASPVNPTPELPGAGAGGPPAGPPALPPGAPPAPSPPGAPPGATLQ